jgi:lysine 2,3-aminomutase
VSISKPNKPSQKQKKRVSTRVWEDVFSDVRDMRRLHISSENETLLSALWEANPRLYEVLQQAPDLEEAREGVYRYLDRFERWVFDLDNPLHVLENAIVRDAVRVMRSIIGPINEQRTGVSALEVLWRLAQERRHELTAEVSAGFLMEWIHLTRAIHGKSGIYGSEDGIARSVPLVLRLEGREAAQQRSAQLDEMAVRIATWLARYPSGLEPATIARRADNRRRILAAFGASESDWSDPSWQLRHVIKKPDKLFEIIEVSPERRQAMRRAVEAKLPFGITPYYLSLMDQDRTLGADHAIRAQVIPPPDYVEAMVAGRQDPETVFDFMGEHDTSPVDLVTRRYPGICILKPFNTCAQICVYCQRNWEIDECLAPRAAASKRDLERALEWIAAHPALGEVLITGGDPVVLRNEQLDWILTRLAKIDHVYRIRIGTRTPVVLPMRWTDELADLLARFHEPGRREVAVVTHFVHPYEITPEAMQAVQKIRQRGMGVYNQQVFTVENSRRFESAKLRKDLRSIGVDPYYTFNMKGKEETRRLMVPIARILQEVKEEARLLPGLDRTDEPVFNVPRLGKNHLRSFQDHRLVMIKPDGSRVYEFHPWEKNIVPMPPYHYSDVPIYEYLEEMASRGEDIRDYRTIWYYY